MRLRDLLILLLLRLFFNWRTRLPLLLHYLFSFSLLDILPVDAPIFIDLLLAQYACNRGYLLFINKNGILIGQKVRDEFADCNLSLTLKSLGTLMEHCENLIEIRTLVDADELFLFDFQADGPEYLE